MNLVRRSIRPLLTTLVIAGSLLTTSAQRIDAQTDLTENFELAAQYSSFHEGDAVLVMQDEKVIYQDYQNGYNGSEPHLIASGTKSFSCAIAAAAIEDELITLDERVTDTITEWKGSEKFPYDEITIGQLLTQTSGIPSEQGMLGQAKDRLKVLLLLPMTFHAGTQFQYSPANFYAFAAVMNRKLEAANTGDDDVIAYLQRRVLDPLGITGFDIRRDDLGFPNLAAGALMTAEDWAKFGQLLLQHGEWDGKQILDADLLKQCEVGTNENPYYGMALWLQYDLKQWVPLEAIAAALPAPGQEVEGVTLGETVPNYVIMAGEGKQRLYLIRDLNLIVVRLGRASNAWSDVDFLSILTGK
jgi:CubicO group peptidase (beta-lactamase class C family)